MQLKLLLFLISLNSITFLSAQDIQISWGPEIKPGTGIISYVPIGKEKAHHYTLQIKGNFGYLLDIDSKMDMYAQNQLVTKNKKIEADITVIRNGDISAVYSEYDESAKAINIGVSTFSTTGKITGQDSKIISKLDVEKDFKTIDIEYFFSYDTSMMLIVSEYNLKAGEMAKMMLTVVKIDDFETVWSTTTTFPYDDTDIQLLSASVDQSGKVILFTIVKGSQKNPIKRFGNQAFIYTDGSGKYVEKTINLEGKFISSGNIKFINDQKILITGFYNELSEIGKKEGLAGPIIVTAEMTDLDQLQIHTQKIDSITKLSITRPPALNRFFDADEINAYKFNDINIFDDGSGYIIAEQNFTTESEEDEFVRRTYYFNQLIIYRFEADNAITSISIIPKIQTSSVTAKRLQGSFYFVPGSGTHLARKYNSFISTQKDGIIYVLYNDHKDNGNIKLLKETKTMSHKNKSLATVAIIDTNGNWEKKPLFTATDLGMILETSSSYEVNKLGFFISAERLRNIQYGMVEF